MRSSPARPGTRSTIDRRELDASRFEDLLQAAREQADPTSSKRLAAEALALWRGPALADVAYEDFATSTAQRLEAMRLEAVECRLDAALDLGEHSEAVAELEALIREHPLREGLYGRLMLALYRSGRQADALRVFSSARSRLGEEFGIEPGPELAALEEAILLQDPSLAPPPRHSLRPSFPAPLTSFVGREREQEEIFHALDRSRLVTLLGPGGVGKTRLALEAVGSMDGDRGFVDLAGITAPGMVASELARALRIDRGQGGFATAAPVGLEDALTAYFRDRGTLLVIDNCEHVVDEAAALIESLLLAVPDLRVVATSRERLGVPGEVVVPLAPLPVSAGAGPGSSDAAALFAVRAAAIDPDFDRKASAAAIDEICVRLDGIPLAIELAAARTRSLTVPAIAARLDDRFRLLSGGSRTAIERQRTLQAAIDWSYRLLAAPEQIVFRRVALFAGPFGLAAAESVAGTDGVERREVLDLLDRLVDQSMAIPVSGPEPRYRLLENIRAYGRDRLAESDDGDATTRRLIDHYAALVDVADPLLRTGEQMDWLERLSAEYDNITAALDLAWAIDPDAAVAMTGRLGWFWYLRGMIEEGSARLQRAIDEAPPGREWSLAVIHFGLSMLVLQSPAAHGTLQAALDNAVASGHWFIEGLALSVIGAFGSGSEHAEGVEVLGRARAIFEEHDEPWGVAVTSFVHAIGRSRGVAEAARLAADARARFAEVGDGWGTGYTDFILGVCSRAVGDLDAAVDLYEASMARAERLGIPHEVGNIHSELANVETLRGNFERAAEHRDRALELTERYPWGAADGGAANAAGMLARRIGHIEEAIEHHSRALEIYRAWKAPPGIAYSATALGFSEEMAGRLDDAERHHLEGLEASRLYQDGLEAVFCAPWRAVEGLAAVEAARGNGTRAATLLGAARRMRDDMDVAMADGELDAGRVRVTVEGLIGAEAMERAHSDGRSLPPGEIDALIAATDRT